MYYLGTDTQTEVITCMSCFNQCHICVSCVSFIVAESGHHFGFGSIPSPLTVCRTDCHGFAIACYLPNVGRKHQFLKFLFWRKSDRL